MCVMGFDRAAFASLLEKFKLFWVGKRKRVFSACDVLGLVLHWTNSTMAQKTIAKPLV